jgi:hypothetical protein
MHSGGFPVIILGRMVGGGGGSSMKFQKGFTLFLRVTSKNLVDLNISIDSAKRIFRIEI